MFKKETKKKEQMWSGIVLLIVVAMLIGIYFLRLSFGQGLVSDNINPNLVVRREKAGVASPEEVLASYENAAYKFKLKYPKDWQASASRTGEGNEEIFSLNLTNQNSVVSVSVMSPSMEGIVKNSLGITEESETEVSGVPAQIIKGSNAKDGSLESMILINKDNRLYSIRGKGEDFSQVVSNFVFL